MVWIHLFYISMEITNEITVYVKGPPRISSPPLQYGMEGQEVQVECLIVSVPPTGKVRWEKDGQLLDIDNNQGIEMIKGESSRCSGRSPQGRNPEQAARFESLKMLV